MSLCVTSVLSAEDLQYLNQLPAVLEAKSKLETRRVVYFSIPLTASIRDALHARLGLDLSAVASIPMRWIQGNTTPHVDRGESKFENTYLVYMNDSPGTVIVGDESYPIQENTALIFNEGVCHGTVDTGSVPRLLLGPMNEMAQPVGETAFIYYFNNYTDANLQNYGNEIANNTVDHILGTFTFGDIAPYTSWRVGSVIFNEAYPISVPTGVYTNGFDMATLAAPGGAATTSFFVYPNIPCFLEGTEILCLVDGKHVEVPVEKIVPGTLVKTSRDGYKKVELIGKGTILNSGDSERTQNRMYKCSVMNYPELKSDLYITGCHSILVDSLTDAQKDKTIAHTGNTFVTDGKYRLPACADERAEPWVSEGSYTIWHFALENKDIKMNYGVYANGGLLVETCSINFMRTKSNLVLQ